MRRFEDLWASWEAGRAAGQSRAASLAELTDEDVIELLTGAPAHRRLDRNILATEALNRMSRARRVIVGAAQELSDELSSIQQAVAESIIRAREEDAPTTPLADLDRVNEVREELLEHIREGGLSELHKITARLVGKSNESLSHTRHPALYARAR